MDQEGRLGRLLAARVHFGEYLPAWHPWEDYRQGYAARADLGGGVLLTQCHSLDYLPWLVGEVESVWGFVGKLSDLEVDVDDTAEIGLRFDGRGAGEPAPGLRTAAAIASSGSQRHGGFLRCDLLAGRRPLSRRPRRTGSISTYPPGGSAM